MNYLSFLKVVLSTLLLYPLNSWGQNETPSIATKKIEWQTGVSLQQAAAQGIDFNINKSLLSLSPSDRNTLRLQASFGYHWHFKSHSALYGTYGLAVRRTRTKAEKRSKFYELAFQVGTRRTYLGETYTVGNDGNIYAVPLAGYTYFCTNTSFKLALFKKNSSITDQLTQGYQSKNHCFTQGLYIAPYATTMYHYNYGINMLFGFQIGAIFKEKASKQVKK